MRRYDFVQVFDGVDENASSPGRFCGKIAPSPITSSGNSLLIKFTSDYESSGAGFSIRYEIHRTGTRKQTHTHTVKDLIMHMLTHKDKDGLLIKILILL